MTEKQPGRDSGSGFWKVMDRGATVALLVAAAVFVWRALPGSDVRDNAVPVPTESISLDGAASLGVASAGAVVVEFSDFQCPYCRQFANETFPTLKSKYVETGLVRFVFRHNPLTSIHAYARSAAEAAECARRQGRFWDMHDRLFDEPERLAESDILAGAAQVGIDLDAFAACRASEGAGPVLEDAELAARLNLRGTPAFLVGRVEPDGRMRATAVISGARPIADFEAAIEGALATQP